MSRTLSLLLLLLILVGILFAVRFFHGTTTPTTDPQLQIPQPTPAQIQNGSEFHNWREYTAPSGSFKVLLPSLPQHAVESIIDPETKEPKRYETFISSDAQGLGFMISAIKLQKPIESEKIEQHLKETVTNILSRNKDNQLRKINFEGDKNSRSLNFVISSGDVNIEGKVFAREDVIYVLSMINRADNFNQSEYEFFVNSFDIQKKDKIKDKASKP